MSDLQNDINDNEIRIISPVAYCRRDEIDDKKRKNWFLTILVCLFCLAIIAIAAMAIYFSLSDDSEGPDNLEIVKEKPLSENPTPEAIFERDSIIVQQPPYVEIVDTIVNKERLSLFIPTNSVPRLHIGVDALRDSSAVLVVQAADIRRDNGEIVGAYVSKGNLLSRGQSKSGFCAIINNQLIIGVANATPYLEQAIESDGYFFRQYPLVVGGQVVENQLRFSSLRKALAELDGKTVVIMSHKKMTLNEFSQTLVDLGVSNAIYLVGSTAFGFAIDKDGNRVEFGRQQQRPSRNTNYIIWE